MEPAAYFDNLENKPAARYTERRSRWKPAEPIRSKKEIVGLFVFFCRAPGNLAISRGMFDSVVGCWI